MYSILPREKAIRYLLKDNISHIDMIEPIKRGTADILYAEKDGVVIYERNSQALMISIDELEKCQSIIDFEKYHLFAVHQEKVAEWICKKGKYFNRFETYQAAYTKKEYIRDRFDTIKVLTSEHVDQVCRNYDAMNDMKYIENLITKEQLWGIFDDNVMVGFIGVHLEGSMGLLKVLPEYRRNGYGYKLEAFLINIFLHKNQVPFCQVMTGNAESILLQQKIGMNISNKTTTWIFD